MKHILFLIPILLLTGCPYEEPTYRVYYHGNNATSGNPPTDTTRYTTGDTATILEPGDLKKNAYTFLGWRDYAFYSPGEKITVNYEDINLYAVWDDGLDTPFSYTINNGEVTITRYNEEYSYSVTIPSTLASKPVTAIANIAFSNVSLGMVLLPDSLKSIGIRSFASNHLTKIVIPDKVESMGEAAFRDNKLTNINLGTGLKRIESYTFAHNALTDIAIPKGITFLGTGAFSENDIRSIELGDQVFIADDSALGTYGASFRDYYNTQGKKAGFYLYNTSWERR